MSIFKSPLKLSIAVIAMLLGVSFLLPESAKAQPSEECGFGAAIQQFWSEEPAQRPTLQNEQIIGTTHFIIHYTLTGPDATTLAWAQAIATDAEECWTAATNLGWQLPPPDNGNGGDNRYDIYIFEVGFNGITRPEASYPTPYSNGYSSWIELRRDPIPNQPISDLDRLKVLVAHEFHHACQLRYTLLASNDFWFYENTSVLMEKVIYPQINYLQYRLYISNSPLLATGWAVNRQEDDYQYPGGLWALFLNEYYEDDAAVRKVWEYAGTNPAMGMLSVINSTLQAHYSSSLPEALKLYVVWRYFTGERADAYHFSDASLWPTSSIQATHSGYPVPSTQVLNKVDSPGGTSYVQFLTGQ